MQTQKIVTQLLQCCTPLMHAARWQALHDVSLSAVSGKPLTLTALALGTPRETSLRHRVKCVPPARQPALERRTYRSLQCVGERVAE